MKSIKLGRNTSVVEVSNISVHGFWILIDAHEHFVDFDTHPWFKEATVSQIVNVTLVHGHHLHWPDLDVDLEIDALAEPDKYPLIFR